MTLSLTELTAAVLIASVFLSLLLSLVAAGLSIYSILETLSAKKSTHTIQFKPIDSIDPLKKMMNPSSEEFDFDLPIHKFSDDD